MTGESSVLTKRFRSALAYAARIHDGHVRKSTGAPYVSHLLAVCALVLEDGGDEDEAIGALLHDSIESCGESPELIAQRFGSRVAEIVVACSDSDGPDDRPPWLERKQRYLGSLESHDPGALRVSCADKLHNARTIVSALRDEGAVVWSRFDGGREETLWYYGELATAFSRLRPGRLARELERAVGEMRRLAGA